MNWYWIVLILVGLQAIAVLIWWLIFRRDKGSYLQRIEQSATKRLQEELEAEKRKSETVSNAYRALSQRKREIDDWYQRNKERIDQQAAEEFAALAVDSTGVDAWLDSFTPPDQSADTDIQKTTNQR